MPWQPLLPAHRVEGGELVGAAISMTDEVAQALLNYWRAILDYRKGSRSGGSSSYSDIEIAKIAIADAYLASEGLPTGPTA